MFFFFFLFRRRPPRSTRTYTLFPNTTLFRTSDGATMGKDAGDDFRDGEVTLPVILAYARGSAEDKRFWHDAMEGRRMSDEDRSEEHTSELQSLMRISYAVFCLKKKKLHKTVNRKKK